MNNQLESAVIAAAEHGGAAPAVWDIDPDAEIQLSNETGHILTGATITAWVDSFDVIAGRNE